MTNTDHRQRVGGFSLLELAVVVAITLVVAAIAIPHFVTAVQNLKLRSTVSGLSGTVQRARMLAVARNNYFPVLCAAASSPSCTATGVPSTDTNTYTFIGSAGDLAGASTLSSTTEQATILGGRFAFDTGGSHPSDTTVLNGVPNPVYSLPIFSPRGLPCFVSAGVCRVDSQKMYITFLRQDRPIGTPGWAAINVTPAGRVQVWTWDGSRWE